MACFSSGVNSGSLGVTGASSFAFPLAAAFFDFDFGVLVVESLAEDFGVVPFAGLGVEFVSGLNFNFFAPEAWGV